MFSLLEEDQIRVLVSIKTGKSPREINRAHCLNLREKGCTIIEISEYLEFTPRTVINICNAYQEGGLQKALHDEDRSGRPKEFDARVESYIVATVCSDPPEGFDRWTLELIKGRLEDEQVVDYICLESIRLILQEHDLKPWRQKMWCVPSLDDEYIERMERVLDTYEMPYNKENPVVCIDEKPVQLTANVRQSIPMQEGQPKRVDCEYKRCGIANVFCGVEPLTGKYINKVTPTRKSPEFAEFLSDISEQYPEAKKITLIMDNLSSHNKKSLTDRFGDSEGCKLWNRLHIVYTPKHASWLNQAEIAIGIYQRQCLGGTRMPDLKTLTKKTAFWNKAVNRKKLPIKWAFTTEDARDKFGYK